MTLDAAPRFTPLLKRALWGGRRLGEHLGKSIGPEGDYAESWEIVDHGNDQSIVLDGPHAGRTLAELLAAHPAELLGRNAPQPRFPLLFKFLDCRDKLSVQVHPNDTQGAKLSPPDLGKTEAWVILAAEPGSVIYAGLKRGFDRAVLAREVSRGTSDLCLHRFEPQVGDCLFLPAGLVHAPGAGLLMAEIQQSSNTTFRLFDWNRIGADGKPRALHIEQGLEVIDYAHGPAQPQVPQATIDTRVESLVACDKFVLERITFDGTPYSVPGDERFRIIAVTAGQVELHDKQGVRVLQMGETCLVPAACRGVTITGPLGSAALSAHLP